MAYQQTLYHLIESQDINISILNEDGDKKKKIWFFEEGRVVREEKERQRQIPRTLDSSVEEEFQGKGKKKKLIRMTARKSSISGSYTASRIKDERAVAVIVTTDGVVCSHPWEMLTMAENGSTRPVFLPESVR